MSSVVISGDTSGVITLQAPAVAGSTTLTLPTTTGTIVTDTATQTLTNKTLTSPTIGGTPTGVGVLTLETSKSATSTSVDFTGIPSWVKRITVMFNGISTNGSSTPQIQIGSGSVTTSGYSSSGTVFSGTAVAAANNITSGFILGAGGAAADVRNGIATLVNISGNIWILNGGINYTGASATAVFAGTITLGGTIDRIRITTVNGTDTFDAGTINIMYE